jgi:hypothetical protein
MEGRWGFLLAHKLTYDGLFESHLMDAWAGVKGVVDKKANVFQSLK